MVYKIERCASRFSTILAKNQVLKYLQSYSKYRHLIPPSGGPPCTHDYLGTAVDKIY
jgi:hypothetical protein